MKEPEHMIEMGTEVITHDTLGPTIGFMVKQPFLEKRRPGTPGIVRGWVGGHGGDVYWVEHEYTTAEATIHTDNVAVYGWMEFELAE